MDVNEILKLAFNIVYKYCRDGSGYFWGSTNQPGSDDIVSSLLDDDSGINAWMETFIGWDSSKRELTSEEVTAVINFVGMWWINMLNQISTTESTLEAVVNGFGVSISRWTRADSENFAQTDGIMWVGDEENYC